MAVGSCCLQPQKAENLVRDIQVVNVGESDSSGQMVGSAPQQPGRANAAEGVANARLTAHTGATQLHSQPPKSQCAVVGRGGSPPSSLDREALDYNGYSTASEITGWQHRCRSDRGSRERKRLVPARLDMQIFKLTDPGG